MTGQLPSGWCKVELAEVVEVLDHRRVPVNNAERTQRLAKATTTYPYYGATGQVGHIDDYLFEGESVLLGEDGAPFLDPYKAKAYLVSGKYWVNNHAHILRGNGSIENRFLSHQLNMLDYRPHVSGTTRLKLTQGSLRELPVKLPPLEEQRRIVEKIEVLFAELDKGEESLREVQKLLARYRQSVLKAAVTGELTADWRAVNAHRLEHSRDLLDHILLARRESREGRGRYQEPTAPDTSRLPRLPEGWTWCSTEQLADVQTGATPKKGEARYYAGGNVPWITSTAVNADLITAPQDHVTDIALAETNVKVFPLGTLIVAMYGEGRTRGKVAELGIDAATNQACAALLVSHLPQVTKGFLKKFYQYNYEAIRLLSSGGVQPNLNLGLIKSTMVPLPSEEEQAEINSRVDTELARVQVVHEYCQTELARSTAIRQSILKDAFAGRLVPQDPANEPAADLLARIRAERETEAPKPRRKAARPTA